MSLDPYHHWFGIPPEQQPPDCYQLLGIRRFEDNSTVIANAAERQLLMLKSHEQGPHAALVAKLRKQVNVSRVRLLNPDQKKQYDQRLRARLGLVATPPPVPVAEPAAEEPVDSGPLLAEPAPETWTAPLQVAPPADTPQPSMWAQPATWFLLLLGFGGAAAVTLVVVAVAVYFVLSNRTEPTAAAVTSPPLAQAPKLPSQPPPAPAQNSSGRARVRSSNPPSPTASGIPPSGTNNSGAGTRHAWHDSDAAI